ncbi:MAG: DsbA family protein [Sphingomonadaceae bacterium]|nr:DsbA family protein [Sphingomonadaceae bacterium]
MRIDHVRRLGIVALALGLAACGKQNESANSTAPAVSAPTAPAVAAPSRDWTEQVAATSDGGFVMGNPNAPVKLIEYGSLTCPHCAEFAVDHEPTLKAKYVATGRVSYEFRNYVRDGFDLTAALLARCNGPAPFFKIVEQLYATQQNWMGKIMNLAPAEQQRIQALPPDQQGVAVAQAAGLDQFMKQRGVGWDKAQACIKDEKVQNKLLDMRKVAETQFQLQGTPTFVINGKAVGSATWEDLEPQLKAAGG